MDKKGAAVYILGSIALTAVAIIAMPRIIDKLSSFLFSRQAAKIPDDYLVNDSEPIIVRKESHDHRQDRGWKKHTA